MAVDLRRHHCRRLNLLQNHEDLVYLRGIENAVGDFGRDVRERRFEVFSYIHAKVAVLPRTYEPSAGQARGLEILR